MRKADERLAYAVLSAVEEIPAGRVASYGQIARLIGRERNARLVGRILSDAERYGDYPCHRVVNHAGRLAPGFPEQRRRLEEEGVTFRDAEHVDMAVCQMKEDGMETEHGAGETASADCLEALAAFRHLRVRPEALAAFGFRRTKDGGWRYAAPIIDGALSCAVTFGGTAGVPEVRVTDTATGDDYALWRMAGAVGRFVGRVRQETAALLARVAAACCEREVFKSEQTHRIVGHARDTWGEDLEYLWKRFPENAVLRRRDTRKWYAAILRLSRRKLGFDSDETVEILDLRTTDATARLGARALPGYHMNKKNWYTVVLDGTVPFATLADLLAASRDRAV